MPNQSVCCGAALMSYAQDRGAEWRKLLGHAPLGKEAGEGFFEQRHELYVEYLETAQKEVPEGVKADIGRDLKRTRIRPIPGGFGCDFLDGQSASIGTHRDALGRILLVYALTNSTIGYVQGMNIICAVLYYAMATSAGRKTAESDGYFCLFNLMVDVGDLFSAKMDGSITGASGQAGQIMRIIREQDAALYRAVSGLRLFEQTSFHLRWLALLFSAEFPLEDTLLLWDAFFKETPKSLLLPYFCASVLMCLRGQIIGSSPHSAITSVQIMKVDPFFALRRAQGLREADKAAGVLRRRRRFAR